MGYGDAAQPLAGVLTCRAITEDTARLACFDRETAALDGHATPSLPSTTAPSPDLNARQRFGLPEHAVVQKEIVAGTRPRDIDTLEARVAHVSVTPSGHSVVTLDNQQVWRQLTADTALLLEVGDSVTISRGLFGSYWLETKQGRGSKVNRLH